MSSLPRITYKKITKPSGYLILETLVAVAILGMLLVSVYPIVNFLLKRSKRSEHEAQAQLVLQEGMEAAYNIISASGNWNTDYPDGDIDYKIELDGSDKWSLATWDPADPLIETRFTRKIRILCSNVNSNKIALPACSLPAAVAAGSDPNFRIVQTTVTWSDSGLPPQSLEADLLLVSKYEP